MLNPDQIITAKIGKPTAEAEDDSGTVLVVPIEFLIPRGKVDDLMVRHYTTLLEDSIGFGLSNPHVKGEIPLSEKKRYTVSVWPWDEEDEKRKYALEMEPTVLLDVGLGKIELWMDAELHGDVHLKTKLYMPHHQVEVTARVVTWAEHTMMVRMSPIQVEAQLEDEGPDPTSVVESAPADPAE